jgi:hypothetical protein
VSSLAISLVSNPDYVERLDILMQSIEDAVRVVRTAASRERATIKFYVAVKSLNSRMREFTDVLDESARKLQSGELEEVVSTDEAVDPLQTIAKMEFIYRLLYSLHVLATVAGLKNRVLTRREVHKLNQIAEHLLDYIVWLKDVVTPESRAFVESTFDEGLQELEAGETVPFR